jgi:hypothetical protein
VFEVLGQALEVIAQVLAGVGVAELRAADVRGPRAAVGARAGVEGGKSSGAVGGVGEVRVHEGS